MLHTVRQDFPIIIVLIFDLSKIKMNYKRVTFALVAVCLVEFCSIKVESVNGPVNSGDSRAQFLADLEKRDTCGTVRKDGKNENNRMIKIQLRY